MSKSPPSSYLNRIKHNTSPTSRLLQQFADSRKRDVVPGQIVPAVQLSWKENEPGWKFKAKSVRKAKKRSRKTKKSVRKNKKSVRKTKKSVRKTKK
jgi:hypothetical protein